MTEDTDATSAVPESDATLAAYVDEDGDVTVSEVYETPENYVLNVVGKGESVTDALRDTADMIESGNVELEAMNA